MLNSQARLFGEALVDRHVIGRDVMDAALDESSSTGVPFLAVLEAKATLPPDDVAAAWALATGSQFVDLSIEVVHPEAVALMPEELIRRHRALPIKLDHRELLVAFAAPASPSDIRAVAEHLAADDAHDLVVALAEGAALDVAIHAIVSGDLVGASDATPSLRDDNLAELYRLFERTLELNGSDLHLAAGQPPFVRLVGELVRMPDEPELSPTRVRELAYSILSKRQQERFETTHELDTSHAMGSRVRFRVNVFLQRNAVGVAFRVIPYDVVDFDLLGLPSVVKTLADLPRGLVLVTGPTGSGKSTTLASLVDIVNRTRQCHIMTIEDPVEFVHRSKVALVNQREVGEDTDSFGKALTSAMRQDPDVILVGEMRDLETISTAITAAETGHLVFATLHTQDAAQTVDRIIDVFPGEQQGQVRVQLANSIQAVATQQLVPTVDGRGRAVACEVMVANNAIRALIRDGKIHQIHNAMTSGKRLGMQSMDESLADLVRRGVVSADQAIRRAKNPDDLARLVGLQTTGHV